MESAIELGNLESLLSPISYGEETPLPLNIPGKPALSTGNIHFQGQIAESCDWGWAYSQSVFRCYSLPILEDNDFRAPVVLCSEPYQFPKDYFITSCTQLTFCDAQSNNQMPKLLIGLNVRNSSGALVIFDPLRGQPMKLFGLPSPVTSLEVISPSVEPGGVDSIFFNEALMAMVGVVAVGLQGGCVILLDLGLDQMPRSNGICHYYKDVFGKRAWVPVFVTPHENNIAFIRHQTVTEKKVIALKILNQHQEEEDQQEQFHYCKPDGTLIEKFPVRTARVTVLKYISPIGLLLVGFDFGGFQLWRIDRLELVYSGSVPEQSNSVFGFSFSQPVDDPKNYSYLWVLYGRQGLEMHQSHAQLYCMEFQDKPFIEEFGFIYNDFQQCVLKLSFKLQDYFDEDGDIGEEDDPESSSRYYVRPLKIWSPPSSDSTQTGNLTFIAWESSRMGVYYVGIFDLNQWYSNRMLESLRFIETTGLCPYWVPIPVETTDTYHAIPICDVQIIPNTLIRWNNPHCTLDIHLYPASLSFEATTLSQSATSTFQHFGVQEKLLRKLVGDGTRLMMAPSGIKSMFRSYGLRPILPQTYDKSMPQDMADRFYIFSALLDNRRPTLIIQFAASWLDGAYSNAGCTVDVLLNWISAYTFSLRIMARDHWEDLHKSHLEFLAPATAHFIHYSNFVWESLLAVFTTITRPDEVFLAREAFINNLSTGLNKIVRYSAALRMMLNAEVLPERSDQNLLSTMSEDHAARRMEVAAAIQKCPFLDSTYKSINPMMIDYLLEPFDEDLLREQWHVDAGESLYPPKHIGYILNLFLTDHDEPKDIARVAAYFLLDIRDVVTEEQKNKLRGDYHSVMQLSADEEAEVYHLWLMDHGYVNEALIYLSQPGRLSSYDLPWCAGIVVCTALGLESAVTRLLKRLCPVILAPLFVKLMSTSAGSYNTIINTDSFKILSRNEKFLVKFFEASFEDGYLSDLITFSLRQLPSHVVESLIQFLKSKSHSNYSCGDWLLSIHSILGDNESLRDEFERMKQLYSTHGMVTLPEDLKLRWKLRERVVESILGSEEGRSKGVMDFIRKCDNRNNNLVGKVPPKHSTVVIRAQQAPSTPVQRHHFRNLMGEEVPEVEGFLRNKKIHPRLKLLKEKGKPNILSPLRRYAARLESDLRTPHRGAAVEEEIDADEMNKIVTNPNDSDASATPVRRAMISILNYSLEEDVPGLEEELEEGRSVINLRSNTNVAASDDGDSSVFEESITDVRGNKSKNYPSPSPINLKSLLQPPEVDHRDGRKSMSFITATPGGSQGSNRSVTTGDYFSATPSNMRGRQSIGADITLHSIMKKRDSTTRRNMEIRFLDMTQNSDINLAEDDEDNEEVEELNKLFKITSDEELETDNSVMGQEPASIPATPRRPSPAKPKSPVRKPSRSRSRSIDQDQSIKSSKHDAVLLGVATAMDEVDPSTEEAGSSVDAILQTKKDDEEHTLKKKTASRERIPSPGRTKRRREPTPSPPASPTRQRSPIRRGSAAARVTPEIQIRPTSPARRSSPARVTPEIQVRPVSPARRRSPAVRAPTPEITVAETPVAPPPRRSSPRKTAPILEAIARLASPAPKPRPRNSQGKEKESPEKPCPVLVPESQIQDQSVDLFDIISLDASYHLPLPSDPSSAFTSESASPPVKTSPIQSSSTTYQEYGHDHSFSQDQEKPMTRSRSRAESGDSFNSSLSPSKSEISSISYQSTQESVEPKKPKTRSQSRADSHDSSQSSLSPSKSDIFDISAIPYPPTETATKPVKAKVKKPRGKKLVGGFAPELSTVIEDPSATSGLLDPSLSFLQQSSSKPGGSGSHSTKRKKQLTSEIESSQMSSLLEVEEDEEVELPKKRAVRTRTKSKSEDRFADISFSNISGEEESILDTSIASRLRRPSGKGNQNLLCDLVESNKPSTSKAKSLPPLPSPDDDSSIPVKRSRRAKPLQESEDDKGQPLILESVGTRATRKQIGTRSTDSSLTSSILEESLEPPKKRATRARISKSEDRFGDISASTLPDVSSLNTTIAQRPRRTGKTGTQTTSIADLVDKPSGTAQSVSPPEEKDDECSSAPRKRSRKAKPTTDSGDEVQLPDDTRSEVSSAASSTKRDRRGSSAAPRKKRTTRNTRAASCQ